CSLHERAPRERGSACRADRDGDPRSRRERAVAQPLPGALPPSSNTTLTSSPRLAAVFGAGFWLTTLPVGLPLPPFILRPAASSAAFASSRFMPVRSGTVVPLPLLVKTRIVVPRPAWPEGS